MASLFSSNRPANIAQRSVGDSAVADNLSAEQVAQVLQVLRGKHLLVLALLWVAAHRPLAFLTGQTLLLLTPSAELLGLPNISGWATLLCHPSGSDWLERLLEEKQDLRKTGK